MTPVALVTGPAAGGRATADLLAERARGHRVGHRSGREPRRWHGAAAEAGARDLVRSAAIGLATTGVRVDAVCPGPIETGTSSPCSPPLASFVAGVAVPVDASCGSGHRLPPAVPAPGGAP